MSQKERISRVGNQQSMFVKLYVANGFNATQAAIKAGYSEKTARSQGQRLLTKADVRAKIQAEVKALLSNVEEREIRWLSEVEKLAYAEPKPIGIHAIPNSVEMRAKVESLKLLGQYQAILHEAPIAPQTAAEKLTDDERRERIETLRKKLEEK